MVTAGGDSQSGYRTNNKTKTTKQQQSKTQKSCPDNNQNTTTHTSLNDCLKQQLQRRRKENKLPCDEHTRASRQNKNQTYAGMKSPHQIKHPKKQHPRCTKPNRNNELRDHNAKNQACGDLRNEQT